MTKTIFPYNIYTIINQTSNDNEEKYQSGGKLVDQILNSLN